MSFACIQSAASLFDTIKHNAVRDGMLHHIFTTYIRASDIPVDIALSVGEEVVMALILLHIDGWKPARTYLQIISNSLISEMDGDPHVVFNNKEFYAENILSLREYPGDRVWYLPKLQAIFYGLNEEGDEDDSEPDQEECCGAKDCCAAYKRKSSEASAGKSYFEKSFSGNSSKKFQGEKNSPNSPRSNVNDLVPAALSALELINWANLQGAPKWTGHDDDEEDEEEEDEDEEDEEQDGDESEEDDDDEPQSVASSILTE